eukprot:4797261-Pyramimonas_sp.AAC.2
MENTGENTGGINGEQLSSLLQLLQGNAALTADSPAPAPAPEERRQEISSVAKPHVSSFLSMLQGVSTEVEKGGAVTKLPTILSTSSQESENVDLDQRMELSEGSPVQTPVLSTKANAFLQLMRSASKQTPESSAPQTLGDAQPEHSKPSTE